MYKILHDNKVIDVVRDPKFLRFLASGHIAFTDKSSANGILGSDGHTAYSFNKSSRSDIKVVKIEEISYNEFSRLRSLLNSGIEASVVDATEKAVAINNKLRQLSTICNNKIIAGFSIILSDGERYRFKLTTEDQLNLIILENQLNAGAETVLYHASDMPCKYFMREDMLKVINAFKKHVLYHTTYFNAVKQYLKTLNKVDEIASFTYGTSITHTVTNYAIRKILEDGVNY
jgi:hypothetical protein